MGEILEDLKQTSLVKSFKVDRRFLLVFGVNMGTAMGIVLLYYFFIVIMNTASLNFQESVSQHEEILPFQGQTELPKNLREPLGFIQYQFDRLVFRGIGVTLFFIYLGSFVSAVGKGFSWAKLLGKKFPLRKIPRFSFSLALWAILWAALFVLIALGVKPGLQRFLGVLHVLLFSYLSLLLIPVFIETQMPFRSVMQAIALGIKKIHLLIVPIAIMLVMGIILYLVLLPLVAPLPAPLILAIIITAAFTYLSWTDWYLALLLKKVSG